MGMLYYECKKCGGCVGLMGQCIGDVKCETCNLFIEKNIPDGEHMFERHNLLCKTCKFNVSFEAMGKPKNVICIKDNLEMKKVIIQKTKRSNK